MYNLKCKNHAHYYAVGKRICSALECLPMKYCHWKQHHEDNLLSLFHFSNTTDCLQLFHDLFTFFLLNPSLITFGAPSTNSLASFRPKPVIALISLITLIFAGGVERSQFYVESGLLSRQVQRLLRAQQHHPGAAIIGIPPPIIGMWAGLGCLIFSHTFGELRGLQQV